jgi:dimethylamine monooxygenase subunit A
VAPFRMQPGLRRLAAGAGQLTPTVAPQRGWARHLREKLAVLGAWPSMALQARPGFDAGGALAALEAQAQAEHPGALRRDGEGLHADALGWTLHDDGRLTDHGSAWPEVGRCVAALPAPWRRAGLTALAFAEDFAVVDGADATIPWLAVALPSHWSPAEKVGRHFAEVHAPVADNRLLITASDHLARLVTGDDRWERFVWTVVDHPRLHAHPQHLSPEAWSPDTVAALPRGAWFRMERQTFIPVPQARQAVFTIRVETRPLAQVIDTPARAAQLHDAIASMSDAVLAYRNLATPRDALLAWLQRQSA